MGTKNKTSIEIAHGVTTVILSQPAGILHQVIADSIADLIETIRAEAVRPGVNLKGRERLQWGAYRLHCLDGEIIIASFREQVKSAVDDLLLLNDFSQWKAEFVMKKIQERVNQNATNGKIEKTN